MMPARQMVCSCEDVTRHDVLDAVAQGHTDLESVKRYTGLGTGICQGRQCFGPAACLLQQLGSVEQTLLSPRVRMPLRPTTLRELAAGRLVKPFPPRATDAVEDGDTVTSLSRVLCSNGSTGVQLPKLPEHASVVIVGGGIMGLATAYHLALQGVRHVVVLERAYWNAGASGRNGGGMRAQWSNEQHVLLMKESLRVCRGLASRLGINVWMRQGGYLFLARSEKMLEQLSENAKMHRRLGVKTQILTPKKIKRLAPQVETTPFVGASYNPDDAVIFPWPFVWGYAEQAQQMGVHLATFTPVTDLDVEAGKMTGVVTARGRIKCDLVINAAAAWAPQVAQLAGVNLPNWPERHEILVTESLKAFLDPLVSDFEAGAYWSQSMRGELVAGIGESHGRPGLDMRSSLRFLMRMAQQMIAVMPQLAEVQVVRQWAGCYDMTPDRRPILGEVAAVGGFYQLNGFVGHGFMMAPVVAEWVATEIAKGKANHFLQENRLSRFTQSQNRATETMIIG